MPDAQDYLIITLNKEVDHINAAPEAHQTLPSVAILRWWKHQRACGYALLCAVHESFKSV